MTQEDNNQSRDPKVAANSATSGAQLPSFAKRNVPTWPHAAARSTTDGSADLAYDEIRLTISSMFTDRLAGMREYPNYLEGDLEKSAGLLAVQLQNPEAVREIREFCFGAPLVKFTTELFAGLRQLTIGSSPQISKQTVQQLVSASLTTTGARAFIGELLAAMFVKIGYMDKASKFTVNMSFGSTIVSPHTILIEMAAAPIVAAAIDAVKKFAVENKVTPPVFVEVLRRCLQPIAMALDSAPGRVRVFKDIVTAVGVRIDPHHRLKEHSLAFSEIVANHPVVTELMNNYQVVQMALDTIGDPAELKSSEAVFMQLAPEIATALRTSKRYEWTPIANYMRHVFLRKVSNDRSEVKAVVIGHNCQLAAQAQSVNAYSTGTSGIYRMTAIANSVQAVIATGSASLKLNTEQAADAFCSILSAAVASGYETPRERTYVCAFDPTAVSKARSAKSTYSVSDAEAVSLANEELKAIAAICLADQVVLVVEGGRLRRQAINENKLAALSEALATARAHSDPQAEVHIQGEINRLDRVQFLYRVTPSTLDAPLTIDRPGEYYTRQSMLTSCVDDVFAVTNPFSGEVMPAVAQVLPPNAIDSFIIGFDVSAELVRVTRTVQLSVSHSGIEAKWPAAAAYFSTMEFGRDHSLVVPFHNLRAALTWASWMTVIEQEFLALSDPSNWEDGVAPSAALENQLFAYLRDCSREVARGFRDTIHSKLRASALIDSSMAKIPAATARAIVSSQEFAGPVDLLSLVFILHAQGILPEQAYTSLLSDKMVKYAAQFGSDRR